MQIVDLETWERTDHYQFFKRMDYPHYNVCMNIEITNFLRMLESQRLPFYYAMIYAATLAINNTEAFRYRIRGEQVVLHQEVHPSFTDMSVGSDLFKFVTVNMENSLQKFVRIAADNAKRQKEHFVQADGEERDDLIYITCVPWVSFTSLSHTISFKKDDSVPRLAWGKYFRDGEKMLLPFSVQAHHSFVDGIHIGRYIDSLQHYLNQAQF